MKRSERRWRTRLLRSLQGSLWRLRRRLLDPVLEDMLAALFPAVCLHCDAPLEEEPRLPCEQARRWAVLWRGTLRREVLPGLRVPLRFLCPACCATLRLAPGGPGRVAGTAWPSVVAFEPSPVLFRLVHALKYESCRELAPFLGGVLAQAARRHGCHREPGVLLPVPLHAARRAERGFNQSQLLAERMSRSLRLPVLTGTLERHRATPALAGIDAADRWQHVAGAFRCRRRLPAPPTRVWLVDDVVTTGATVRAVQEALPQDAGIAGVLSLCRAHEA